MTRRRRSDRRRWRGMIITLLSVLVGVVLIRSFLLGSYYIPSGSMLNTLRINDRIQVIRLYPSLLGLSRGDVVVFRDKNNWIGDAVAKDEGGFDPLGWLASLIEGGDSNRLVIKRVIGLPGDEVSCCNDQGQMVINGKAIDETPYLYNPYAAASKISFSVRVPEGRLWVMGDNRNNSSDSRAHLGDPGGGFVPMADVIGKAWVVFWPIEHWSVIDNHQGDVFKDVPSANN